MTLYGICRQLGYCDCNLCGQINAQKRTGYYPRPARLPKAKSIFHNKRAIGQQRRRERERSMESEAVPIQVRYSS